MPGKRTTPGASAAMLLQASVSQDLLLVEVGR